MNAPHHHGNDAAERAIICAILRGEQAYWQASELLRPEMFAKKPYGAIFAAVRDIVSGGRKITLTALTAALGETYGDGESMPFLLSALRRAAEDGEADGWHDMVDQVVDAWRARVASAAMEAAKKELAKDGAYASDVLADLKAKIEEIEASSQSVPVKWIGDVAQRALVRSTAAREGGKLPGVDMGLPSLDEIMGRAHGGDFGVLAARQGDGKGQPLDALVLTPYGYRRMGDIRVGTMVTSPDGSATPVIGVYPLGDRQIYRVSFHDGTSTEVTDDHIWLAWENGGQKHIRGIVKSGSAASRLYTTAQLIELMSSGSRKFHIPVVEPVPFNGGFGARWRTIDPYVLGVLLGDGCLKHSMPTITSADREIIEEVERRLGGVKLNFSESYGRRTPSYRIPAASGVRSKLESMGLWGKVSSEKFIPPSYLTAPIEQRWDLLRGLMDTDGWVNVNGDPRYCSKSERLARDVAFLARSLGGVCTIRSKKSGYNTKHGEYKDCGIVFEVRVKLKAGADAFRLQRKKEKCNRPGSLYRTITSITPCRIAPAQCIKVAHPSALYVTNDFIVTHNTLVAATLAQRWALYGTTVFFQLEMRDEDMARRALAAQSGLSVGDIEEGAYDFDAYDALQAATSRLKDLKLAFDDRPGLRVDQIYERCRAMKRSHGLIACVIDHLRLVKVGKAKDKWEKYETVSGTLRSMAKDLGIIVLLLSQVTRSSQRSADPVPLLTDMDGGGVLEQDADWVLTACRRDQRLLEKRPVDMDSKEGADWKSQMAAHAGKIEIHLQKHRRMKTGEFRTFVFQGRTSRILEVER